MFKRELKFNLKSFIIWTAIILVMYLVVFLVYPSIMNSDNVKLMDEMMQVFSPEMLKAFNMDISSIDTAYGWLKTEGFIFILLIIGSYAAITGSNILLKEESDKTIEYLNSLPVKRSKIVFNKFMVGIIYVTLMTIIVGVFNYFGLLISGSFDKSEYIILSITPLFPALSIYALCFFISTFLNKTKKMLGISLGIVFISYLLNTLAEIAEVVEFLKYFSFFTLADVRNVIIKDSINPIMIGITGIFIIAFYLLALVRFNKKDLI